jgi:hypothetical protein
LLPIFTLNDVLAEDSTPPIVSVSRDVGIGIGGMVIVVDVIRLEASFGEELLVEDLWLGDNNLSVERAVFELKDDSHYLELDYNIEVKEGFNGYSIELPSPVTVSGNDSLEVKARYLLLENSFQSTDKFTVEIPVFPVLNVNISSFTFEAHFPEETTLIEIESNLDILNSSSDNKWNITYEVISLPFFSNDTIIVSYTPSDDDKYLIICDIKNIGAPITEFQITLSEEASNLKALDAVGPIEIESADANSVTKNIMIKPRSVLFNGIKWSFTISYDMPTDDYITKKDDQTMISYPKIDFPYYVRNLSVVASIVEGEKFKTEYGSSLPSERQIINVSLPPQSFLPLLRPIGAVLVLVIAVGAIVIYRKRRVPFRMRRIERKVADIEVPKITIYLNEQKQRLELLKEIESIEKDFEENVVKREEFDSLYAELQRKMGEKSKIIRGMDEVIIVERPEVETNLESIKKAEAILERLEADLRNLEVRFRARRISRRDYERRRRDRIKRRIQVIKQIQVAINELERII